MKRRIKRFFYKIKRVIDFIPIIWKGYDFDYYSSIELFKYQLKRTAKYLESDKAKTLEAKTNAAKIWTAVELIECVKLLLWELEQGYPKETKEEINQRIERIKELNQNKDEK